MEHLWSEFRSAPSAYFQSSRTNPEFLVAEMTQVLTSEQERREQVKLTVLGIWQEMCHVLFKDADRLLSSIRTLKDLLNQQRSPPLFLSQVLCTITTLLIEMELTLPSHSKELADFICILFEYIEKMKSESNRLLKSIACDCLRELEMTYPGLLASKVGHFYGMSVAENSHIHQHYKALFATVLDHALQKFLYEQAQESPSSSSLSGGDTLDDLLSYSDPLKSFKVPPKYKEIAIAILGKKVSKPSNIDVSQLSEVKKAVSFVLDWSHLFTPSCLLLTSMRLISCVQFASFSPKILMRLFQHSPSQDIRLFQLMLLLKLKFGSEICNEVDEANLRKRLLVLCRQSNLPDHHRVIAWEWLIQWPLDPATLVASGGGGSVGHTQEAATPGNAAGDQMLQSYEEEESLRRKVLQPTPFDSFELFLSKSKALCLYQNFRRTSGAELEPFGPKSVSDLVVNLLKLVRSGDRGPAAVTLYRVLYYQYTLHSPHITPHSKETEKLVLELVLQHPQLMPNTIDFITSVQANNPDSPLPVNVISEVTKWLASIPLVQLLQDFPLHLMFIKFALGHPQINPVILLQLLTKVLSETSLCGQGVWETGNTLIEICTTAMRVHPTSNVFKDLSALLQLMAENYGDLDVRDRASFYYQLMLTVSADKLSAILTLASDSSTGSSLSDIVEARISDTLFPSASPIRKISNGESFLSLERVLPDSIAAEDWTGYGVSSSEKEKMPQEDREGLMRGYFHSLDYPDTNSDQGLIHIRYSISFFEKPQGISNTIYALVLTLSTSQYYHPSPDVYIPFLSLEGNGSSVESKVITFTIKPREPVPSKFEVSAVFSTEEGVTYSTHLSPISLNFTDFFLPVPHNLREKAPADVLFSCLWDRIESLQHLSAAVSEGKLGVLSVVHLEYGRGGEKGWASLSSKMLETFEVSSPGAVEGEEVEEEGVACAEAHNVLLFLPPRYHLLLKFHVKPTSANISIATDNWRLLPLVNIFLHSLIS